jgi:hypothetical protein
VRGGLGWGWSAYGVSVRVCGREGDRRKGRQHDLPGCVKYLLGCCELHGVQGTGRHTARWLVVRWSHAYWSVRYGSMCVLSYTPLSHPHSHMRQTQRESAAWRAHGHCMCVMHWNDHQLTAVLPPPPPALTPSPHPPTSGTVTLFDDKNNPVSSLSWTEEPAGSQVHVQDGGKDAITLPPGNVIETLRAAGQFNTFLDLLQVGCVCVCCVSCGGGVGGGGGGGGGRAPPPGGGGTGGVIIWQGCSA